MRRAERLAWGALAGLLVILAILITGGIAYQFTAFWAGAMLVGGQAVAVGLAAWGLMLARQAKELNSYDDATGGVGEKQNQSLSGFRMSAGDDAAVTTGGSGKGRVAAGAVIGAIVAGPLGAAAGGVIAHATRSKRGGDAEIPGEEVRTLDTGFQRLMVFSAGFIMVALSGWAGWLVYGAYRWKRENPGQTLSIVGPYTLPEGKPPQWMDEACLLVGLGAALIYGIFYWITRPTRETRGHGEAVSSTFTLGITGMGALAVGTLLGYFHYAVASEVAAGVMALFMLLQGLELIVNSLRSYSSIEELDQEAVDLQATPLGPMLGSMWLSGLRMLFAESVGLAGGGGRRQERGVIARIMPRALAAMVVIAIVASCIRVVQPGQVAVLERLGYAATDKDGMLLPESILHEGLHFTFPWPIDELVTIPNTELRLTNVGTELHAPKEWKNVQFQFWTVRTTDKADETEDEFITGDSGSAQLLETFIQVRWRVANPALFYKAVSHSDFFEKSGEGTKALPIYEAMVQQCTSFAVTRTFAIHSLDQIMISGRTEVEQHCRQILQEKLDSLNSGIHVEFLTIKDLHPPFWRADRYDPGEPALPSLPEQGKEDRKIARGPASAFEFVVSMRENMEQMKNFAEAERIQKVNLAKGEADAETARAETYKAEKVAKAQGDALRLVTMTQNMDPKEQEFQLGLLKRQLLYTTFKELTDPVTKIIVDPTVKDLQIIQTGDRSTNTFRPTGN